MSRKLVLLLLYRISVKSILFERAYLLRQFRVFYLALLLYFVAKFNRNFTMLKTTLNQYDNSWYQPGRSALVRLSWYFVNCVFFQSALLPFNALKVYLLRLFGARVGRGATIKPSVNIKYPWRLRVGDHVWIGEGVWIDNLADVTISNQVCLSQGAMLLTGSHDYKRPTFDLITGDITLEEGVWVGARAVVCPGVTCGSHSVLSVNSVATTHLEAYKVYQGNPAVAKRERIRTVDAAAPYALCTETTSTAETPHSEMLMREL